MRCYNAIILFLFTLIGLFYTNYVQYLSCLFTRYIQTHMPSSLWTPMLFRSPIKYFSTLWVSKWILEPYGPPRLLRHLAVVPLGPSVRSSPGVFSASGLIRSYRISLRREDSLWLSAFVISLLSAARFIPYMVRFPARVIYLVYRHMFNIAIHFTFLLSCTTFTCSWENFRNYLIPLPILTVNCLDCLCSCLKLK